MGNFCPYCGRALTEGEVCNCRSAAPQQTTQQQVPPVQPQQTAQQQVPPVQPQQQGVPYGVPYPQQPQQPSQAGIFFKKFFGTFLGVIKTPVAAGRAFVGSMDYLQAGAFVLVQAVLAALFGLVFEAKIGSYINQLSWYTVKMPYAKVIAGTFGLSVVFSAALAGLLLLANLIFQNKTNYQTMLCLVALRSIVTAPVIFLAIIVAVINPFAGAFVFFAGNVWAIIVMALCMPTYNPKSAEFVPLYVFLAFFVFMIVTVFIMWKCVGLYIPSSILNGYSSLSSLLY
jgi:hypothetical protein